MITNMRQSGLYKTWHVHCKRRHWGKQNSTYVTLRVKWYWKAKLLYNEAIAFKMKRHYSPFIGLLCLQLSNKCICRLKNAQNMTILVFGKLWWFC